MGLPQENARSQGRAALEVSNVGGRHVGEEGNSRRKGNLRSMDPLALISPGCCVSHPTHPVRALGIGLGTTDSTGAEILWRTSGPGSKVRCLEADLQTLSDIYTRLLVCPAGAAPHCQTMD